MWGKIAAFLKGFFSNAKADPVSTGKGFVQLAAAGAVSYGMATGVVPVRVGAPIAASFAASGVHAIGTNSATGVEASAAVRIESLISQAAAAAPVALSVVDQISVLKSEADDAQKKVEAFQSIAFEISKVLPPEAAALKQ